MLYIGVYVYSEIRINEVYAALDHYSENRDFIANQVSDLFNFLHYRNLGIWVFIATFALLYIGEFIYLGARIHSVVEASYNSYGEKNTFSKIVSDDVFMRICYRNGCAISSNGRANVKEKSKLSFPFVFHWIFGGKATYR
jgi:hypothetical protein